MLPALLEKLVQLPKNLLGTNNWWQAAFLQDLFLHQAFCARGAQLRGNNYGSSDRSYPKLPLTTLLTKNFDFQSAAVVEAQSSRNSAHWCKFDYIHFLDACFAPPWRHLQHTIWWTLVLHPSGATFSARERGINSSSLSKDMLRLLFPARFEF